jgi:class 3 adenylate cyclase
LLDIMMPQMNGYQVLESMQRDTRWRNIPVIVISASEEEEATIRCIELGASDYLPKPYDPVLLRSRIGACIEKKRLRDQEEVYRLQLEREKKLSEDLLHGVFPYPVAQELKATGKYRPRRYPSIAVLFCDLVGFTQYCDRQDPEEVVDRLQEWVEGCETLLGRHRLEKIKTVGDALMAAGGLLVPLDNPVLSCVQCGSEIIAFTRAMATGWNMRVGVHVGPVVVGIVGKTQYAFDIWGDTVNLAARIEQNGVPGAVNVSGPAWQQIARFSRGEARMVEVKGKGRLEIIQVKEVR